MNEKDIERIVRQCLKELAPIKSVNLETAKLYLGEYKGMDISGVYLENPGGCTVVCYRADGSYEVPTNETRISLEGISYIKLVGEGKLTQLRIKGFA